MTFNAPFAATAAQQPRFFFEPFPVRRQGGAVAWMVRDLAGHSLGMVVLGNTGKFGAYRGTRVVGSFPTKQEAGSAIERQAAEENAAS